MKFIGMHMRITTIIVVRIFSADKKCLAMFDSQTVKVSLVFDDWRVNN